MHNFQDDEQIKSKIMGFPTIMYLNKKNKKSKWFHIMVQEQVMILLILHLKILKNSVNVEKKRKAKKQNKKNNKTKKKSKNESQKLSKKQQI